LANALAILLPLAAVGTTLKMARFLWLTWPQPGSVAAERTKGLWLPWLGLVAAALLGVWVLPGALGWLPVKLTPKKLWLSMWPLLVGCGLTALGVWLRRWLSQDFTRWLPPGDLGVVLEKSLMGLRSRMLARPDSAHGQHDGTVLADSAWASQLAGVAAWLGGIEKRLRDWPFVGSVLLVIMGLLLWLLAEPRS
jgi:hypothetical protein